MFMNFEKGKKNPAALLSKINQLIFSLNWIDWIGGE